MNFGALLDTAHRAMPVMPAVARVEVDALVKKIESEYEGDFSSLSGFKIKAARAWERDMQPVRTALAAALHAGTDGALQAFSALIPGLLREVNRAPSFSAMLMRGMMITFLAGLHGEASPLILANAISISAETLPTDGMRNLAKKDVFETDLGSAELRGFSRQLKERAFFSARTTNAEYLGEVRGVVDDVISGKINQATGRLRLLRKLKELGYDPAVGFPDDMANIPPAERGSLQDLSSTQRLDLVIETNVRMASNYGRMIAGNQPYELREYPAWELKRIYAREVPRGERKINGVIHDDPRNAWLRRWEDAAEAVQWRGVSRVAFDQGEMIARKDSPIWMALGDGEGGFTDTLGNPYPPFAFRSGMGWRVVPKAEAQAIGLGDEPSAPMTATIAPEPGTIAAAWDSLPEDLQAELRRELEAAA